MPADRADSDTITIAIARRAKDAARKRLASVPGVVGVGLTRYGIGYAVKVNLDHAPRPEDAVPPQLDGVPIVIEVVGVIAKRR